VTKKIARKLVKLHITLDILVNPERPQFDDEEQTYIQGIALDAVQRNVIPILEREFYSNEQPGDVKIRSFAEARFEF
jgi:hypothetical protein